jgi:glycosyltransferase involved in cell wall biosynthesis
VPIRIANVINGLGPRDRHTILTLDGATQAAERLDPALGVAVADPGIDKRRPVAALRETHRRLRALDPDLLLTYNWGAIEWALVNRFGARVPHLHFESGFGPEEATRQIPRRVWLRRIALARSAALVVPSQTLVAIARDVWRMAPDKLRYVPNGVDCEKFASSPEPGIAPGFVKESGELIVGTVSPLRPEKNIARLLRAFARLAATARARLVIVGDGGERPALERLAAELGIAGRTVFTGYVSAPEKILGFFDVFAISSDTEQMPNALIQAMANGRAVAGVDVGDVRHIVCPENRELIAPAGDDDGLRDAIARLLDDDDLRSRLGHANARHVRAHYDQDTMFRTYAELFAT